LYRRQDEKSCAGCSIGCCRIFPLHSCCLRPRRTALMSYAAPPLLVCAASLVPLWLGGVGRSIAAIGFAVGLWWLIIRLIGFAQAGFGVGREAVSSVIRAGSRCMRYMSRWRSPTA